LIVFHRFFLILPSFFKSFFFVCFPYFAFPISPTNQPHYLAPTVTNESNSLFFSIIILVRARRVSPRFSLLLSPFLRFLYGARQVLRLLLWICDCPFLLSQSRQRAEVLSDPILDFPPLDSRYGQFTAFFLGPFASSDAMNVWSPSSSVFRQRGTFYLFLPPLHF